MEKFLGKKEKFAIKGNEKQWAVLFFIHSTKLCTKFKILGQVFPEKSVTEFFPIHYIGERDMKKQTKWSCKRSPDIWV